MPTEKRDRQRANREAKLAQQAKADKRRKTVRNGVIVVVIAVVVGVTAYLITRPSTSKSATTTTAGNGSTTTVAGATPADAKAQKAANAAAVAAGCPASPSTRVNSLTWSSAPPMTIDSSATYTADFNTTAGPFTITLDAKQAPRTVNNFVFLAKKGFYRCVTFHRVIPGFVDQTGDPTGTGNGGPGYTIPDEYPPKAANAAQQYPLGSVAMANTGQPHSGGSQWFVVAGPQGESLPNTYSLFGHVTAGMSTVQKINSEGSTSGVPPDVTQRVLAVTIHQS